MTRIINCKNVKGNWVMGNQTTRSKRNKNWWWRRSLGIRDVSFHELMLVKPSSIMGIDPWQLGNWIPISWWFNFSQHNQLPLSWSNCSWEEMKINFNPATQFPKSQPRKVTSHILTKVYWLRKSWKDEL